MKNKEIIQRKTKILATLGPSSNTIKKIIESTLALSPLNEIWKEGKHIIEKEIITSSGESYRPDRIIKHKGNSYLIDFKTGEEKSKDQKQIRRDF